MKLVEHLGNKLPIYILLSILGLLTMYYATVYVPGNEDELNGYAVRVLQNKAASIKEKYLAYSNAINSAPLSYFSTWYFRFHDGDQLHILERNGTFYATTCPDIFNGTLRGTIRTLTRETTAAMARCDQNLRPSTFGPRTHGIGHELWRVTSGDFYFVYSPNADFYLYPDSIASRGNLNTAKPDTANQYFWLRVRDFTANLKSNDFFDDVFIVRDARINNDDVVKRREVMGYNNEVLDESRLGIVRFQLPDSATQTSPEISTRTIAGKKYRVYYQPLVLGRGLGIYVIGLVAADTFSREARQVEPWFFVLCALGSLILILSLPLLKLFFLNSYERLSASDAKFAVFSVIASVSLVVTIIAGGFVFWGTERQSIDERLSDLSKRISGKLNQEVDTLREVLSDMNLFVGNLDRLQNQMRNSGLSFNEIFSLTEDGYMTEAILRNQGIRKNVDSLFPVRLAERRYYREAQTLLHAGRHPNYFLESINSLHSGKSEAALSIPYPKGGRGVIRVVTSPLPSLINPVIPSPYKFVVLDHQGIILFHSGGGEHRFENFILECDNDEGLKAHLTNNVRGHVDFNYLRNDCRGYVSPLLNDWHLVVYYELAHSRNFAAQIFSLCLITLVIVTLYSIVLHLILKHHIKKPHLLSIRPFMFDWLNPNQHDASVWKGLMWINLGLFIAELGWIIVNKSVTLSLSFVFLMMTLTYFTNYKRLTRVIPIRENRPLRVMFILILVWSIVIVIESAAYGHIALAIAVTLFVGAALAASALSKPSPADKTSATAKNGQYYAYTLYLYSWLMVIAIGPTLIFFADHFRFNNVIRTYSYTLEDVRSIRASRSNQPMDARFVDYTDNSLSPNSAFQRWTPDTLDVLFYARAPRYIAHDPAIGGLQFNYVPAYRDYSIAVSSRHVQVTSKASSKNDQPIHRMASLSYTTNAMSLDEFYFMIAGLVALGMFWWAMRFIPRRIFYMPRYACWRPAAYATAQEKESTEISRSEALNRGTLISDFSFEFQDDDQPQHPLHDFKEKEKLLADYRRALDKAECEEQKELITEEFIIALQGEADDLYAQALKGATEDERFLLYDLAEDGVANQADHVLIEAMAKKGLVRRMPKLEIVNSSFANYVKETMNREELAKRDAEEGTHGRWRNLRTMLIIVIIAVIAFLSFAEQDFISRASAVLISLGTLIPGLINIFGKIGLWLSGKTT